MKQEASKADSIAMGSGLGSKAAFNLFPVREDVRTVVEHSPSRLLHPPVGVPLLRETHIVRHSPTRHLPEHFGVPLVREFSPNRASVPVLVRERISPVRTVTHTTIQRGSPVRSRSPFREVFVAQNSTIKHGVALGQVSVSNTRTISTHMELMAARQDQYNLDQQRHAAQVDAALNASLGARERICAAYRAEIQCLNLTLQDFASLKSRYEDLQVRFDRDEKSFKDWQQSKEDELERQEK